MILSHLLDIDLDLFMSIYFFSFYKLIEGRCLGLVTNEQQRHSRELTRMNEPTSDETSCLTVFQLKAITLAW